MCQVLIAARGIFQDLSLWRVDYWLQCTGFFLVVEHRLQSEQAQ